MNFFNQLNDPNTLFGKMSIGFDSVGVMLTFIFYGLGIGQFILDYFPPVVLALTVISLLLNSVARGIEIVEKIKQRFGW